MGGALFLPCFSSREKDEVNLRFASTRIALYMTESEFWRLYLVFKHANQSGTGRITYAEMVDQLNLEVNDFTQRLYKMFCNKSEQAGIGFKDFAMLTWNVCTSDVDSLSVLAFCCYDRRGKGVLDLTDIETMFREIFGSEYRSMTGPRGLEQQLCQLDMTGTPKSARVNLKLFVECFCQAHTALLSTFTIQRNLQEGIVGVKFWREQTYRKRRLMASGHFSIQPVLDLLNEHRKPEDHFVAYGEYHFVPKSAMMEIAPRGLLPPKAPEASLSASAPEPTT